MPEADDMDEDDEIDGDRPARLGFRGIPTWEEAVGMIVKKNLDTRAKRQSGGLPKVPAAAAGRITIAADAADEADEAAENLDRKIFPKRDLLGWQLHRHRKFQNAHRRISIMQPSKELIDELFWERVESARRMLPEEKLIAGFQLYDLACKIIADGIRTSILTPTSRKCRKFFGNDWPWLKGWRC